MKMKMHQMSFGKKGNRITLVHMNKPISLGLIGMLQSPLFSENIALVIDASPEDDRDYTFACLAYAAGNCHPRILMDRELFYDVIRGSAEARFILFHEIGHYVNQDCAELGFNNDTYQESRINATENSVVSKHEAAADDFAVRYFGREQAIKGLSCLLSRIKGKYDNEDYDANDTRLAIKELEMRIQRIRESSI